MSYYTDTPAAELRAHIRQSIRAMQTSRTELEVALLDNDHQFALEQCQNLQSQTRGLAQLIEAANTRHLDLIERR